MIMARLFAALALILSASMAQAHIASNGFLKLNVSGAKIAGSIELAIRDGELAVGIDRNGDGRITWGELKAAQGPLQNYVQAHLKLRGDDRECRLGMAAVAVNERVDGNYLSLPVEADCATPPENLSVEYTLLSAEDPSHPRRRTLSAALRDLIQDTICGMC